MTEIKEPISIKKNFDFVDTIRCLSMIGIVFEHVEEFGGYNYASFYTSMLQISVVQFFKFSTIAFFLIAAMFLYRYIIAYPSLRPTVHLNRFHFFIYLCTFEILPLALIYKELTIQLLQTTWL